MSRTGRIRQNDSTQALYNHIAKAYDGKAFTANFTMLGMGDDTTNLSFGTHFNPVLAKDSNYFKALDAMMQCAEKNRDMPESTWDKVCASEFKALRLCAFREQLMYHHVNKRFFIEQLTYRTGQAVLS